MSAPAKRTVELFYDVISPYSWIGFEVICRYRSVWPINLKFKPFFLGGIMKGSGNQPPGFVAAKMAYQGKDLARLRRYYDLPLNFPKDPAGVVFGKGSLLAQRFITAIDMSHPEQTEGVSREFSMRIWSRDQDVTEPESLREAGKSAGLSDSVIEDAMTRMQSQEVKDRLKAYTEEALAYGAFGAPTFVIHGDNDKKSMLFGSDRFHIMAFLLGVDYPGPMADHGTSKL